MSILVFFSLFMKIMTNSNLIKIFSSRGLVWYMDGKVIPTLFIRKEDCCGCTACYAICPKSAISMVEDEEGFEYPKIDDVKCVRCGMCLTVCPIKFAKNRI